MVNISGKIYRTDGQPYSNGHVKLQSISGYSSYTAYVTAGDDGSYSFINVIKGTGRISFWANQASWEGNPNNPLGAVNLTINQSTTVNITEGTVAPTVTPTINPL